MKNESQNTVVLKVGTSTLTTINQAGYECLDHGSFERIGLQLAQLRGIGHNVVIVSSAGISAGVEASNLKSREQASGLFDHQRLASIGWGRLLNAWENSLQGATVGGLLLTHNELERDDECNEAVSVVHNLLENNCVAIVNENDSISHQEIEVGDNDTLAARLAVKMGRSALFGTNIKLVILTDKNGVLRDIADDTSVISKIHDLSSFNHVAHETDKQSAKGGMITKFNAAEIALQQGISTWITNGRTENTIQRALEGEIGTHIVADKLLY